ACLLFLIGAANELAEPAVLLVLVQEWQVVLLEPVEPLLPWDRLERVLAAESGKVDTQHSGIISLCCSFDVRRFAAAGFHPATDWGSAQDAPKSCRAVSSGESTCAIAPCAAMIHCGGALRNSLPSQRLSAALSCTMNTGAMLLIRNPGALRLRPNSAFMMG